MGFVLSILYFITYYLTPTTIFGSLAVYRIELILAALVLLASLPRIPGSFIAKTPQSLALGGLALASFLSVLIGDSWAGGGEQAFLLFIPNAFAYFLVCLHCDSKKKLQVLILMLLFVCFFVMGQGLIELRHGVTASDAVKEGELDGSYLLPMTNSAGEWFYRLRGQGEIHDPNDFAQLMACVMPLVFIFWHPKKKIRNLMFVILPVSALLYGTYLTHSRGVVMALLAMVVVAARRRIGTLPSLLFATVLYAATSALHFTGGRDISADAGQDRLDLWSDGLQLLKSHPLFGVGFGDMINYGNTAHNTVIVCGAELGLVGLYFWSLFLFPTVKDVLAAGSLGKVSEADLIQPEKPVYRFQQASKKIEVVDKAEINRLGHLAVLSLTGSW